MITLKAQEVPFMTRYRERDERIWTNGSYYNYLSTPPLSLKSVKNGNKEFCWDTVGNPEGDNPFIKVDDYRETPVLNGTLYKPDGVTVNKQFTNFPTTHEAAPLPALTAYPIPDAFELNALAWETLAATNINAPHVSVPNNLGELRDLPSIIKGFGDTLLKKVAAGYLTWRWAIKPMIGDIQKLWTFTKAVNSRIRYLKALQDGKVIKRKATLDSDESTTAWEGAFIAHSNGALVQFDRRYHTTMKTWGTVRYNADPSIEFPASDDIELKGLAQDLVLGTTPWGSVRTAWELMPWSWFVDWFLGVGTLIDATGNTVPLEWSHNCIMRTLTTKSEYVDVSPPSWATLSGVPVANVVRKERYVAAPSLPFALSLPLLDSGKWSILGALAALRYT